MKRTILIAVLAGAAGLMNAVAQENDDQQGLPMGPGGKRGRQGAEGRIRPPVPPVIVALDANGDKVIDADEIANASAALKTLDKNGDGQLTQDELMPPRPKRPPMGGSAGGNPGGERQGPPPGAEEAL